MHVTDRRVAHLSVVHCGFIALTVRSVCRSVFHGVKLILIFRRSRRAALVHGLAPAALAPQKDATQCVDIAQLFPKFDTIVTVHPHLRGAYYPASPHALNRLGRALTLVPPGTSYSFCAAAPAASRGSGVRG